jgi:hypothetical protein
MGIFDAFSAAPGQKAATDQVTAINQGKQDLTAQYGAGRDALTTNYSAALQPYTQEFGDYTKGTNELADAMGLNGPEGNARAATAFQNDPGYQFRIQQGNNAVMANQARTGQSASGNTLLALQQQGQNTANQGWNQYIQNLQPYLGARAGAATGIAGVDTGLGNALNANYTGLGGDLAGLDTAAGKAQAGGDMAGYNASGNLIGAGLGLAGDAASIFGGGGGAGGNMAKSLFGKFLSAPA